MSITIPTSELLGGLTDVLPQLSDDKGDHGGVQLRWDGEALHFTTYDINSAATVYWIPGQGDEVEDGSRGEIVPDDDVDWGGYDDPWVTWVHAQIAKEIVKVFKLPGKLWRWPVKLSCPIDGASLTVEREDGPRAGRTMHVPAHPAEARTLPDVRAIAYADRDVVAGSALELAPFRIGAFAEARPHGVLRLIPGGPDDPIGVTMGNRFAGFVYRSGAKGVHRYSVIRDGAGVLA